MFLFVLVVSVRLKSPAAGVAPVDSDRFVKVGKRIIALAFRSPGGGTVEVCLGEVWIEFDRLCEIADSAIDISIRKPRHAMVGVSPHVDSRLSLSVDVVPEDTTREGRFSFISLASSFGEV